MSTFGNILKGSLLGAATGFYMSNFGKSEIDIYFQGTSGSIKLPVNPSQLTIPQKFANKTAEIVALGEVNVLGNPNLKEIKIESYFPANNVITFFNPNNSQYTPDYFVNFFQKAAKDKKPLKITVTRLNISMLVSVEAFERSNHAGDHDDIYYSLELKEYKKFGASKLEFERNEDNSIKTDESGNWIAKETSIMSFDEDALVGDKNIPEEVLNTEKGNIAAISKKYTGSWDNWQSILDANKENVGDGLQDYFGKKLKIPEVLRSVSKSNSSKF